MYFNYVAFLLAGDVHGNTVPKNKTINIQYSNILYSISCQLADYQHTNVYWIKISKEINGSYWDIVDVHRNGETNITKWFPGTDLPSRSSNVGSDLNNAKLVLNLHSNSIKESDNGVYKCKINTMNGVYSDTLEVDWRGMHFKHINHLIT